MAALAMASALAGPALAAPITMKAFMDNRLERFDALKAGDPDQPARIEAAKARTAQMVAAAGPIGGVDAAPVVWHAYDKPIVIFEDPVAPRMVVIPAGEITIGSGVGKGRARRRFRMSEPVAIGLFPVVVGEFATFVAETGYQAASHCTTISDDALRAMPDRDWRNPGVTATPRDPVTCVAYADALAYAAWLSKKTGRLYRLPTSAEYEYANRAGTATTYWWGNEAADACTYANGYDQDGLTYRGAPVRLACHDGRATAAPVGTYKPNGFGLFDMSGNVESWTSDCADASCRRRVLRGGSWQGGDLAAAGLATAPGDQATSWRGFRLVRVL